MISRGQREAFNEQLRVRRRGRPRSAAPAVVMSVKLPERIYDALCRRAALERRSLHGLVKEALAAYTPN
jgi:hypothetical protein